MTNAEKYKDLILSTNLFCDEFVKPFVLKKYGLKCGDINCGKCYAATTIFLNEEYQELETDWSKVPVDTSILVSDTETDGWIKRHFAAYKDGMVYAWENGCTSFTSTVFVPWAHAKLVREEKR